MHRSNHCRWCMITHLSPNCDRTKPLLKWRHQLNHRWRNDMVMWLPPTALPKCNYVSVFWYVLQNIKYKGPVTVYIIYPKFPSNWYLANHILSWCPFRLKNPSVQNFRRIRQPKKKRYEGKIQFTTDVSRMFHVVTARKWKYLIMTVSTRCIDLHKGFVKYKNIFLFSFCTRKRA